MRNLLHTGIDEWNYITWGLLFITRLICGQVISFWQRINKVLYMSNNDHVLMLGP